MDAKHQEKSPAAPAEPPVIAATPPAIDSEERRRKPPPEILPDDTPGRPRHEDFLPFFQLPGESAEPGGAEINVPPSPNALPPSSATYRQR
ncbi:MAG TPA: hypothetical protein VG710_05900 [Opitutus sp.]|nr:hypothetical protein [Opitutus sp.]